MCRGGRLVENVILGEGLVKNIKIPSVCHIGVEGFRIAQKTVMRYLNVPYRNRSLFYELAVESIQTPITSAVKSLKFEHVTESTPVGVKLLQQDPFRSQFLKLRSRAEVCISGSTGGDSKRS